MSQFKEWLAANTYPHGEVDLSALHSAFTAGMSTHEKRQWTRGVLERELAGHVVAKGRTDQPRRVVVGHSFDPPQVNRKLAKRVLRFFETNTVYRYEVSAESCEDPDFLDKNHWILVVNEQPDFSPERYRIPFSDIAARLTLADIRTDAMMTRLIFQRDAKHTQEAVESSASCQFATWEGLEAQQNQHVRCLTADAIVGFRWRLAGEREQTPYFGPYTPTEGEKTRLTKIGPDMVGA